MTMMYQTEQGQPHNEAKFVAGKFQFKTKTSHFFHSVTCLAVYVITWCLSKAFDMAQTIGQLVFLIIPVTLTIMFYAELITIDQTGVRYHHDKLQE